MPKFNTSYGKKPKHNLKTTQPTMTKQSHKNECDINQIMAKFQKTGIITHGSNNQPIFGEISADDYHQSMNLIAASNSMFEELPSSVRKRFENDPAKYLAFFEDSSNSEEMQKMGFTLPPKSPPEDSPAPPSGDISSPPSQED